MCLNYYADNTQLYIGFNPVTEESILISKVKTKWYIIFYELIFKNLFNLKNYW